MEATTATLIMLDKPILVNEEQPAQTDYAYKNGEITLVKLDTSVSKFFGGKLVIAGVEGTKRLTFNLSEEDAKRIGYVDVDKLAEVKYPTLHNAEFKSDATANVLTKLCRSGFIEGANTYASLTPKKYTEEDMLEFGEWLQDNKWWKSTDSRYPHTLGLWTQKINGHFKIKEGKTLKDLFEIFLKQRQPQQFKVEYTETETEIIVTKIL